MPGTKTLKAKYTKFDSRSGGNAVVDGKGQEELCDWVNELAHHLAGTLATQTFW